MALVLDCMGVYDATGGGVGAVITPNLSLTVKGPATQMAYIVGYSFDGISAEEVTITNPNNRKWPAGGVSLKATSDGTAVGAGDQWKPLPYKIPVWGQDTLVFTITSGANPVHVWIYIDYPPYSFGLRDPKEAEVLLLWTRATTAGGTNCSAGTMVQGATPLTSWGVDTWKPVRIDADAAFTTTAFLGLRKQGGDSNMTFWAIGLTDVANDMKSPGLPKGMGLEFTGNDICDLFWVSHTAEQPTAKITFARRVA